MRFSRYTWHLWSKQIQMSVEIVRPNDQRKCNELTFIMWFMDVRMAFDPKYFNGHRAANMFKYDVVPFNICVCLAYFVKTGNYIGIISYLVAFLSVFPDEKSRKGKLVQQNLHPSKYIEGTKQTSPLRGTITHWCGHWWYVCLFAWVSRIWTWLFWNLRNTIKTPSWFFGPSLMWHWF